MIKLEEAVICRVKYLVLRVGGKTYYINTASQLAFEDEREVREYDCPGNAGASDSS